MLGIDPNIVKARKPRNSSNRRITEIDVRAYDLFSVQYFLLHHLMLPPAQVFPFDVSLHSQGPFTLLPLLYHSALGLSINNSHGGSLFKRCDQKHSAFCRASFCYSLFVLCIRRYSLGEHPCLEEKHLENAKESENPTLLAILATVRSVCVSIFFA